MRCPQCGERETRVVDSRDLDDAATIRRRRECAACATRFTTYERIEAARLVVKARATRQEFRRQAAARLHRHSRDGRYPTEPLTRRPTDRGELRAAGRQRFIVASALASTPCDRPDRLHRFASVYQSFEDLEDLKREVDTLYAEREPRTTLR
jgi:transcriptional repressor NrdR